MKKIYCYDNKSIDFLSDVDKELGKVIENTGIIKRYVYDDFFEGLCYNIINQQLSMKSADTIFSGLKNRFGTLSPEKLTDENEIRNSGLPKTKACCISECAVLFSQGRWNDEMFGKMTDSEVIEVLTKVRGIGIWTAEMTLIFCLGRQDILSLSDYGIRKGLNALHGVDVNDKVEMEKYRKLYSPYGTVASFYLWEAAKEKKC